MDPSSLNKNLSGPKHILGISAFYHDSAAALVRDGKIIAAAQEERFSRIRHDAAFPARAIDFCLKEAGIDSGSLSAIVYYDKPFLKFERLFETYMNHAPRGLQSFLLAMPVWLKEKLFLKSTLRREFSELFSRKKSELPPFWFCEHHQSHAASAFFPSPFPSAAVLCLDGVGEWATTSLWRGHENRLEKLWEIHFPHSLGLLYSAFTYYTGFKVNSGEYKLMGLAPYGNPIYVKTILENLIDLKPDGTFRLNLEYFDFMVGLKMTSPLFDKLFAGAARKPETNISQKEMDLAASIQKVTEEVVLRLARTARRETGEHNLCLAGGVALNCVANGLIQRENIFERIWIQPAAGDAGGAVGAALAGWHQKLGNARIPEPRDSMAGAYLGPSFSVDEVRSFLQKTGAVFEEYDEDFLLAEVARALVSGSVVGWFQGRMEFGPRALGARSILGDPRNPQMQSQMNVKIKYRESFRPFAPAIPVEQVSEYFDLKGESPYMLLVASVKPEHRFPANEEEKNLFGIERLKFPRSKIPAVTHLDYSARVQTVHKETNPRFHKLLNLFGEHSGVPILVNTSFNVRGEPIVCTPEEAYVCFKRTEMDVLVLENFILRKSAQKFLEKEEGSWQRNFPLD